MNIWRLLSVGVALGLLLLPEQALAHNGDLFSAEITKIEQLITGAYMRLGLLAVCATVSLMGVIKQSFSSFILGIVGCVFVYFAKGWILTTFTMVI